MPNCLVIDDVAVTRFSAMSLIEDLGLETSDASDGDSALVALDKGNIDVILLDWHLKKKCGIELLQVIRSKYKDSLKVIVFSGVEGDDKAREALGSGADGFILKPTTKDKLELEFKKVGIL